MGLLAYIVTVWFFYGIMEDDFIYNGGSGVKGR